MAEIGLHLERGTLLNRSPDSVTSHFDPAQHTLTLGLKKTELRWVLNFRIMQSCAKASHSFIMRPEKKIHSHQLFLALEGIVNFYEIGSHLHLLTFISAVLFVFGTCYKIVKPWPVATQWLSGRKKLVSRWSIDHCFGWSYFFSVVFARKTDVLELCFALDFLRLCFQMWKTFDYWQLWRIWTFENTGNFRNTQKLQKIDIVRYSEILL